MLAQEQQLHAHHVGLFLFSVFFCFVVCYTPRSCYYVPELGLRGVKGPESGVKGAKYFVNI